MCRDERDGVDRGRTTAGDAAPVSRRTADRDRVASDPQGNVVPLARRRGRVHPPERGPDDDDPGPAAA